MRKFEVGDKVTVVASQELLNECFLSEPLESKQGVVVEIGCDNYHGSPHSYLVQLGEDKYDRVFLPELGLESVKETTP